jgi:hypothetical protein
MQMIQSFQFNIGVSSPSEEEMFARAGGFSRVFEKNLRIFLQFNNVATLKLLAYYYQDYLDNKHY